MAAATLAARVAAFDVAVANSRSLVDVPSKQIAAVVRLSERAHTLTTHAVAHS